jgi:hypothetical protein
MAIVTGFHYRQYSDLGNTERNCSVLHGMETVQMIFRDYQEIAKQALCSNGYKPHLAAAEIGIEADVFCDVLTGGKPDTKTIYRLLIYMAYMDCQILPTFEGAV